VSVHGQTIIQWFEHFSPKHLAVEGDKIGLQIGTLQKQVTKVMVTLDVTEEVVDEAIKEKVDLIIAHHPIIYRPLSQLRTDLPGGRVMESLIKHDIAVYIAHTNLDVTKGGVNDWLAHQLELEDLNVLSTTYTEALKKLVVFVPQNDEEKVREALGNAGAGWIGNYSHCTFRSEGLGTFLPREGTNPHIGQQGKMENVGEVKIETIFPKGIERKVVQAMLKAHPYEEVAYDIYTLDQQGEALGLGRVGKLRQEMTLEQFAQHVKKSFDVPFCRVVGALDAKVNKVAVLGGTGNKYVSAALFKGADVFVTGDIEYHTAQDAEMNGLHLVDPGHHIEKVMMKGVQDVLHKAAHEHKAELEVITSKVHTEPFRFI
jgi:dinuclear metal center YbgI/SA1388 family protein